MPTPRKFRALALAVMSLALVGAAEAQGHGGRGYGYGGGHYGGPHGGYRGGYGHDRGYWGGPGWGWGVGLGVGLGVGIGLGTYGYPWYAPGYTIVDPGVTYVQSQPVPAYQSMPAGPVIYPRNGQSAQQQDADSSACSEWSGQQPNATRDPSVFQRGMAACLESRGYTVR
ncbi:MAG: hypothetical protein M3O01_12750 [Pseudomonadota bacterium]|nr:hypothetical protein [Pseudomonadota bacterium]